MKISRSFILTKLLSSEPLSAADAGCLHLVLHPGAGAVAASTNQPLSLAWPLGRGLDEIRGGVTDTPGGGHAGPASAFGFHREDSPGVGFRDSLGPAEDTAPAALLGRGLCMLWEIGRASCRERVSSPV